MGVTRNSARAMSRRVSASRTAARPASSEARDGDPGPGRTLGGLHHLELPFRLIDQPPFNGTPLGQLEQPAVLMDPEFPVGAGRFRLGLGLLEEDLGHFPFRLSDPEAGVGELEPVLPVFVCSGCLRWLVASGPRWGWDGGRVLGAGRAGDELPGDDRGSAGAAWDRIGGCVERSVQRTGTKPI
jgi:hypothetical protein